MESLPPHLYLLFPIPVMEKIQNGKLELQGKDEIFSEIPHGHGAEPLKRRGILHSATLFCVYESARTGMGKEELYLRKDFRKVN